MISVLAGVIVGLIVLFLACLLTAFQAWVLMVCWNFVMPLLFPAIVHLTFWPAVALTVLINMVGFAFRASTSK